METVNSGSEKVITLPSLEHFPGKKFHVESSESLTIQICPDDELHRLARLGAWADQFGVEAVRKYATQKDWGYDHETDSDCDFGAAALRALDALPMDGK